MAKLPLRMYLDFRTFRNSNYPNNNIQFCSREDIPNLQQFFIQINCRFFSCSNCFSSAVSWFSELLLSPREGLFHLLWLQEHISPLSVSLFYLGLQTHSLTDTWVSWSVFCSWNADSDPWDVFAGRSESLHLNDKKFPKEGLKWNKKEGKKISIFRGCFPAHCLISPSQHTGWVKADLKHIKSHTVNTPSINISRRNSSDWA